jgi:hypothetical protein
MDKSIRNIIILLGLIVVALLVISVYMPKQVDWSPSFNTKDKVPLGLYVLDHEIDSFQHGGMYRMKDPLIEYFYEGMYEEQEEVSNTIFYINSQVNWNHATIKEVCRFVREGNTTFISAIAIPLQLRDSLGLLLECKMYNPLTSLTGIEITLGVLDSCEHIPPVIHDKGLTGSYITKMDSSRTKALGYVENFNVAFTNFVEVRHGKGRFLLHLEPAAFTNYFLLTKDYHQYAEYVLSHIPKDNWFIWSLDKQTAKVASDSPLRFINSQPALKWAWWLLLLGVLLFVLFNVRRNQRIIPVVPPVVNTSTDFVKTIGNLYFLEGDIRNLMDKKIIYLLERIRSEYQINTEVLDEAFTSKLEARSGLDRKKLDKMIFLVNKHLSTDYTVSNADLERLNKSIESVFNQ